MARRRTQQPSRSPDYLFIAVVLLLLLAIGVLLFVLYRRQQEQLASPATQPAAATESALLDPDRIVFGGVPRPRPGASPNEVAFTLLKNSAYVSGYSETRKDPLWVGYRVFATQHPFNLPRPQGGFITDNRLRVLVKDSDFTHSGYDRGHMAPNSAIAHCYGPGPQIETFLLSNICPQSPALNEKVWERLETAERAYAEEFQEVWIIDGPIFADINGGSTARLASGIAVPSAFYKILVEEDWGATGGSGGRGGGKVHLFAVIMPQNVKGTELPQQYVTSVREIEKETHLDFLWKLEDTTEEELETKVWPMWPRLKR